MAPTAATAYVSQTASGRLSSNVPGLSSRRLISPYYPSSNSSLSVETLIVSPRVDVQAHCVSLPPSSKSYPLVRSPRTVQAVEVPVSVVDSQVMSHRSPRMAHTMKVLTATSPRGQSKSADGLATQYSARETQEAPEGQAVPHAHCPPSSGTANAPGRKVTPQEKPDMRDAAPPKVQGKRNSTKEIGIAPASNLHIPSAERFSHLKSRSAEASRQFVDRASHARRVSEPAPGRRGESENFEFYRNRLACYPHGDLIETIHEKWWGDYRLLETHHSYIQWLFPNRRRGQNRLAPPLTSEEAEAMRNDTKIRMRVLRSFEMLLDFFGMKLKWRDAETPENRSKHPGKGSVYFERSANFQERYRNLRERSHNNLRITRIILCLGELGWQDLQVPWVKFLASECQCGALADHSVKSLVHYWLPSLEGEARQSVEAEFAGFLDELGPNGQVKAASRSGKSDRLARQRYTHSRAARH